MLTIIISEEGFDQEKQEFVLVDPFVLEFEHSLISLSKWEAKFEKAFLGLEAKTQEETLEYIKMMVLTKDLPNDIFDRLSVENLRAIEKYIDSKQSATTFVEHESRRRPSDTITSELIYYWMFSLTIPLECETWHLNRLFALIRIFGLKNGKQKRMSKNQISQHYRDLNEQRKAKYNTLG